jgi:protein-S-isoprenylcysteine O-methyltransferase Ste14
METKYLAILTVIILTCNRFRLARKSATFKEKKKGAISNRWTYSLLSILYIIIILGSIIENYFLIKTLNLSISFLGLFGYVVGIMGRNRSIKTLGQYWSTHIEIRNNQRIVQKGPYRYIRHPGYLSLIIETLSIPGILNAYHALMGVTLIFIPAVLVRAKLEDMEMGEKVGEEFTMYKERVGAFIPKTLSGFVLPFLSKKR